jgi:bifunctional pyridoxal-dependent enzyme with beta-cystathionase and maltose regulon repressor activities
MHPDLDPGPLETLRLRRSEKWATYPADVLPVWVAEMDYPVAPAVTEAVTAAAGRHDYGYAPNTRALAGAFASFARRRLDWPVDPAQVTTVPDVMTGVVEVLRVLLPGGTVVIDPPVYPPFFDRIDEAGCRIAEVPLLPPGQGGPGRLDLDGIAERAGLLGVLAAEAAFEAGDDWLDALLGVLDGQHRRLARLLARELPEIGFDPPRAGYLAWLDCRALDLGADPAAVFLQQGRVALTPGPDFGRQGAGFARLNVATSPAILDEAVARMAVATERARAAARSRETPQSA